MPDIEAVSSNLALAEDGIWYSKDSQDVSYPSDASDLYFSLEDNSFWFRHRNKCIISAVNAYSPGDDGTIYDVGGGNGYVAAALAESGFVVVVVEPGKSAALNARRRGLANVICATTDTARFKPHSLPAVGLFDVVEHIEDDLDFLRSLRAVMKAGGRLYVTVPAYPALWSGEDVSAGHYRRYTRRSIGSVLAEAGFEVEFSTCIFRFLPVPIALFRVLPYRLGLNTKQDPNNTAARDHATGGGVVSSSLDLLLKPEIENIKGRRAMRFGGSCLVVAKSP